LLPAGASTQIQGGQSNNAPVREIQPEHDEEQKLIVELLHADRRFNQLHCLQCAGALVALNNAAANSDHVDLRISLNQRGEGRRHEAAAQALRSCTE